jgi:hypothetical protein
MNIFDQLNAPGKNGKIVQQRSHKSLPWVVGTAGVATGALGMSILCPTAIPFIALGAKAKIALVLGTTLTGTGIVGSRAFGRFEAISRHNKTQEVAVENGTAITNSGLDKLFVTSLNNYFVKPMLYTGAFIGVGLVVALANKSKISL